ncbi:putative metallopeptidase [Paenibacillus sp. EPM92]|uniref:putative metallopeptidase n=1 Tax=Paenibacillus sp. EPM92 TaxID=1561195 RepID=UPI00191637CB|nr:putative metallopeptidase [Paenibacillus sp. EPM92]
MAKKEKFHSTAPQNVVDLLEEVIGEHHKELAVSNFLVLFKHGGWKSKGKTVLGKVRVLSDDLRRTMNKDVILYLNADMWAILSQPQKKYVLDHNLYTLDLKYNRHGDILEAADGRPLLTTVPHDIEGFVDVVRRHGIIMEDVKRLARAMTETTQITLEDALKFEPNENAADEFRNKVAEAEPRDGIKYTVEAGVVEQVTVPEESDEKPKMPDDEDLPY